MSRKVSPLIPSDCIRGGRTEIFRLHHTSKLPNKQDCVRYCDVTTLYPFVMSKKLFPWSDLKIHPRPVKTEWSSLLSQEGVSKVLILAKSNLLVPILPFNCQTNSERPDCQKHCKVFFPLCRTCVEKVLTETHEILEMKKLNPSYEILISRDSDEHCFHTDEERSWIGTYTHPELRYALENEYEIIELFESWVFGKTSTELFAPYISLSLIHI